MVKFEHTYICETAARMFLAEEVVPDPNGRLHTRTLRRRFLEFCVSTMLPEFLRDIPDMELWLTLRNYLMECCDYEAVCPDSTSGHIAFVGKKLAHRAVKYQHIPPNYSPVMSANPKYNRRHRLELDRELNMTDISRMINHINDRQWEK